MTKLGEGSGFHNWRLERAIARGGSGTVFLATHQLVKRSAAVKVIVPPTQRAASQAAIKRFYTEVELNVSLRLPNLPDFYDAELLEDGTAVLVLEYLDGTDLAGVLRQLKPIGAGDALFVLTEILRTLQVLHTRGVHRDIKPSNIFVRRKPRLDSEGRVEKRRVTLLDFGIAKLEVGPTLTEQNTVIGTRCYMSPEQLRGRPVDARSDLYSAGAVLYEMLGGHPPFVPDPRNIPSLGELAIRHASQPLDDLRGKVEGVSEELWRLLRQLLAIDPADRLSSAREALAIARALSASAPGTRIFNDDEQEPLSVRAPRVLHDTVPMREDRSEPATEASGPPSATIVEHKATERLKPEGEATDPWQERQIATVRRLLRAPRIFRAPAVVQIDPATGETTATRPLTGTVSVIGAAAHADVRVVGADGFAHQATLLHRPDGTIDLESANNAATDGGVTLDLDSTAAGEIVHGTAFRCAGSSFRLIDLAVVDPPPATPRRTRAYSPILSRVSVPASEVRGFHLLNAPITIVGSLAACDFVIPSTPPIAAAVWLRGDGELELVQIDESLLPYGQPVTRVQLLSAGDVVEVGPGVALRLDERG